MRNLMILAAIAASCSLTSCDFLFSDNNHVKIENSGDTTQKVSIEEIDPAEIQVSKEDSLAKTEPEKASEEKNSDAPATK